MEGEVIKLWKEEDYPNPFPPTTEEPPKQEDPPASEPQKAEEPPVEPEPPKVVEQQEIDYERVVQERLGRPTEEIKGQLQELERLRKLAVEDEELVPDEPFLKDLIKAYKRGGKQVLEQYIEAFSVDFSKMTPEQVVEYSVRKELGKGAPKSEYKRAYEAKMKSMGWSEDLEAGTPEHNDFLESLTWRTGKMKEELAKELDGFKIPERQQPQAAAAQEIDQKAIDAYIQQTRTDASTLRLLEQKAVNVGGFQIQADPERLVGQALDTSLFLSNFITNSGAPDYDKFYKMAAIAAIGPDEFLKKAVADAIAKERLKWIEETKNPSTPEPKPPTADTTFRVRVM